MASKIKGRPPKQPKVTPALPSEDSQQLHENNPGKTPQGEGGGEGVGPKVEISSLICKKLPALYKTTCGSLSL